MDRPPPGPGADGRHPPFPPGDDAGAPDTRHPTRQSAADHATPDAQAVHPAGYPGSGYRLAEHADTMPTTPLPRLPGPAGPSPATPEQRPPTGADVRQQPPVAPGSPAPTAAAPGDLTQPTDGVPPNARYEGDWSDWMLSADGYPPRPRSGPAESYIPEFESVAQYDGPPEDGAADSAPLRTDEPPEAQAAPTTARERLRARLTPSDSLGAAPPPAPAHGTGAGTGRTKVGAVLLGAAGVVALAAAAYVQFAVVGGEESTSAPAAAAPSAPAAPEAPAADPACPAERVGNTVQGNGPGGTGSGPEVVFAFQHAYYVARSGEQARTVVAPDAAVPSAADIQRGIDSIPAGTTHCIRITPGAFVGQYTVVVTEHRPGAAPLGYNPQLVTTMRIGDRTVITGIGPMP